MWRTEVGTKEFCDLHTCDQRLGRLEVKAMGNIEDKEKELKLQTHQLVGMGRMTVSWDGPNDRIDDQAK